VNNHLDLSSQFFSDLQKLKEENAKLPTKVWELIIDIFKHSKNPNEGIGKPEPLKGDLSGYYSRRITDKHRLIYKLTKDSLNLVSCFGHYSDK
jgi:toxin YoeB